MVRKAGINRTTKETRIDIQLDIDGQGNHQIATGVPYFDHMLAQIAQHGLFDLQIEGRGDLEIDYHHTVEDVGIALGQAFQQALGNKEGIERFGQATVPLNEALISLVLDISGRPFLAFNVPGLRGKIGNFDAELIREFFQGFVSTSGITLHINLQYGNNLHHMAEAIFKAFAWALRQAVTINQRIKGVPSTKGEL
ncbi:MAG: imidazoleglycerol-phosphate dehydratase [Nitrospinae bacterium RIFCSPLOWO2_12_FULL_45_22]|nr:MAG: imidazoleglycerol-phosphate dehydratase [Nitrospinae bacterium RIFCSPLOWO2_12_FULL_45_22]